MPKHGPNRTKTGKATEPAQERLSGVRSPLSLFGEMGRGQLYYIYLGTRNLHIFKYKQKNSVTQAMRTLNLGICNKAIQSRTNGA